MLVWFRHGRVDVDPGAVVGRLGLGQEEEGHDEPQDDRAGLEVARDARGDRAGADGRYDDLWSGGGLLAFFFFLTCVPPPPPFRSSFETKQRREGGVRGKKG